MCLYLFAILCNRFVEIRTSLQTMNNVAQENYLKRQRFNTKYSQIIYPSNCPCKKKYSKCVNPNPHTIYNSHMGLG